MDYSIRAMKKEDLDEVMNIERQVFTHPWQRRGFETEILLNNFARYFVAYNEKGIIGYAGMWVVLDECHLTTLAVDNGYQHSGIGLHLMMTLIERALKEDVVRMSLEVRPSNIAARRLYGKLGFTIQRVRKKYYPDEDAIVMINEKILLFNRSGAFERG